MKSSLFLPFLTYLTCFKSISALPALLPRQQCDSVACLNPLPLWSTVGGTVDWFLDYFRQPDSPATTPPTIILPNTPDASPIPGQNLPPAPKKCQTVRSSRTQTPTSIPQLLRRPQKTVLVLRILKMMQYVILFKRKYKLCRRFLHASW